MNLLPGDPVGVKIGRAHLFSQAEDHALFHVRRNP
jgi:hypothetical protein